MKELAVDDDLTSALLRCLDRLFVAIELRLILGKLRAIGAVIDE